MIGPGSIMRRIGETRQYRLVGYREWRAFGTRERMTLAIMRPLAKSMIKEVYEPLAGLVEVKIGAP
jgi:transcription elongation GreA/GreB family factor